MGCGRTHHNDEQARRHWIQCSGVTDAAFTQHTPHHIHNIMAGVKDWLIDKQKAVQHQKKSSSGLVGIFRRLFAAPGFRRVALVNPFCLALLPNGVQKLFNPEGVVQPVLADKSDVDRVS